jgi:hypothetical protein
MNKKQNIFSGCHSIIALRSFKFQVPDAKIEILDKKYLFDNQDNSPYRGRPVILLPDGRVLQKELDFGYSNFFPDSWDQRRILREVEHAVNNNMGYIPGTMFLHGFSSDGIEIQIGYDSKTGDILTYFPIIW